MTTTRLCHPRRTTPERTVAGRTTPIRRLGILALMTLTTSLAGCWTRILPTIDGSGGVRGGSNDGSACLPMDPFCGAGGASGVADGGALGGAHGGLTSPNKLDILFMVDNSSSMAPLQAKMQAQIPAFINALANPTTGQLPQLHVAVISSSMGAGAWANVNQCGSGSHPGDDRGYFQQGPGGAGSGSCPMLNAGATFLDTGDGLMTRPNFTGDIRDALKCTANLGDTGCGFESQFASTYYALYYARQTVALSPENGGFLRPDARLAIVMLTNEDDCSVAANSLLLDPAVNSVSDPAGLGALASYRCNEFGHLCDGQAPPHNAPAAGGVTLNNCVSAENMGKTDSFIVDPNGQPDPTSGHLWPTVRDFAEYIRAFKDNPNDIFVAAIAGPPTPYHVSPMVSVATSPSETVPVIDHSCSDPIGGGFADPAVRIKQWVDTFGANGAFFPICAGDFQMTMIGIGAAIQSRLGS